jgi:hypothetical protein
MRAVRWFVVAVLAGLQLVMKGPVWGLIARVDIVGGSTSWHRFLLIDGAINHFNEWWLLGTQDTAHWAPTFDSIGLGDVTNQFVLEGVRGGFATFVLFVWLIVLAFSGVGALRRVQVRNRANVCMAWALGISILAHCVNFIGVSYYGQIDMVWYLALAMVASVSCDPRRAARAALAPVAPRRQLAGQYARSAVPAHAMIADGAVGRK